MSVGNQLRRSRRAMIGVEQSLPPQQDAGEAEQPVGNPAQGAAIRVAACPQGLVAGTALGVVLHGDAGSVEHGLTQPDLSSVAHNHDAALAAAFGHGCMTTVVMDLERRRVADLLADRTSATVAEWLRRRPEVEAVARGGLENLGNRISGVSA